MAHSVAVTMLQPFQGPLPLSSLLTLIRRVLSPQLCCMVCPSAGYSSPLGQESFFLFCPFTTIFFNFASVSTLVLFLPFPFLYYYFSVSSFPTFSSLPFQYYLNTSSFVPRDYVPPLNFTVTELFSSPSSLRYSPVLKSALLFSLVSQPCTW